MYVGGIEEDSLQPLTGPTEDELNRLAAEVFEAIGEQIVNLISKSYFLETYSRAPLSFRNRY